MELELGYIDAITTGKGTLDKLHNSIPPKCLHVGMTHDKWVLTDPQTHLLVVAPARSKAGKSASVMIPNIIAHNGPCIVVSTKTDNMNTTMAVRRIVAESPPLTFGSTALPPTIWQLSPDGAPTPEGIARVSWSPVSDSADMTMADIIARGFVEMLGKASSASSEAFFHARAIDVLSSLLHWAAHAKAPMSTVYCRVATHIEQEWDAIAQDLSARGAYGPAQVVKSVSHSPDKERSGVLSTVLNALYPYKDTRVMADADAATFSMSEFVSSHQTVYITGSSETMTQSAPLIAAFLASARRTRFKMHAEDFDSPYLLMALDEMAATAPNDLPRTLADAGSQGVLVVAAIQDLSQVIARWHDEGRGFLSLFQNILVYPGIRHRETLELLSELVGDQDREIVLGDTPRMERVRTLPPGEIAAGIDEKPRLGLFLPHGDRPYYLWSSQYWNCQPWWSILKESVR